MNLFLQHEEKQIVTNQLILENNNEKYITNSPRKSPKKTGNILNNNNLNVTNKSSLITLELFNAMFPPKRFIENSITYQENVSMKSSTRADVLELKNKIDQYLIDKQARERPLCPIRENVYSEVFDELIRQITLESPERGLLLLRIRDEIKMSTAVYLELYNTSIEFGIRKTVEAENGMNELEIKKELLEKENKILKSKIAQLTMKNHDILNQQEKLRIKQEKRHNDMITFLKNQINNLKTFYNTKIDN